MIATRAATVRDAPAIGALFAASRRLLTFLPELHTPEEDMAFIRDVVLVRDAVKVAELDGRLAGFIACAAGWVNHLYLDPACRRRGIGTVLIAGAQSSYPALELWCFTENLPARAFYETHGFIAVETTDGAGNEAGRPDIRYRWTR